jgi:hypothetical protein
VIAGCGKPGILYDNPISGYLSFNLFKEIKMELRSVIVTPDGKQFDTKAEAMDYMRRPKILAALGKLEGVSGD